MNILVVDDSALMRGLVKRAISSYGGGERLSIHEADDGESALATIGSAHIDLVLLDWNMPVLDGLSFVREVRSRGVRTPIVMISAVTDPSRMLEAVEAGVSDYIQKPVQVAELWERIQEHVEGQA